MKVTPSAASAASTISASRMSWKGRTFDSRRDLTFSEIHLRVDWDTVGLLVGTGIGSCNHQSLSQGGRHLSILILPDQAYEKSECHSFLTPFLRELNVQTKAESRWSAWRCPRGGARSGIGRREVRTIQGGAEGRGSPSSITSGLLTPARLTRQVRRNSPYFQPVWRDAVSFAGLESVARCLSARRRSSPTRNHRHRS